MATNQATFADTKLVRFESHHDIKEGVSHEEFVQFLEKEWIPAVLPILKSHGVARFSITLSDPKERADLREKAEAIGITTGKVSDFDCISTYLVPSLDTIFTIQASPEWQAGPAKIQVPWVSVDPLMFTIGKELSFKLDD